jgi:hypothetical protein
MLNQFKNLSDKIKRASPKQFISNYYLNEAAAVDLLSTEKSVILLSQEYDFLRLFFSTCDLCDLSVLTQSLKKYNKSVVLDYIVSNGYPDNLTEALKGLFRLEAVYDRYFKQYNPPSLRDVPIEYAAHGEGRHIHELLLTHFNILTDHIPDVAKIEQYIADNTVIITRDTNGTLNGFIIYSSIAETVHGEYLYSGSGTVETVFKLFDGFYKDIKGRGFKRVSFWVNRKNKQIIKMYLIQGYHHDKRISYVFISEF